MIKHNQDGAINSLVVSLVVAVLLLIATIIFGAWAYTSRQDYKDNTDAKISAANKLAVAKNSIAKDKQFAENEKSPLKTYNGPEAYGSIVLLYPKTWSGYVDNATQNSSNTPVNGYFEPGVVPSVTDMASVFALRIQVLNKSYAETLKNLTSTQQSQNPPVITPYALPKVPKAVGVQITGQLPDSNSTHKTGTMIVLPLRSETLEVWTEGNQFIGDFNNYILPNLTFSP